MMYLLSSQDRLIHLFSATPLSIVSSKNDVIKDLECLVSHLEHLVSSRDCFRFNSSCTHSKHLVSSQDYFGFGSNYGQI